ARPDLPGSRAALGCALARAGRVALAVPHLRAAVETNGDFIFWMDADDRLDAENRDKLRRLFARLPDTNVACSLKCLCPPDPSGHFPTVVDHVRIFRNHRDIRWR